MLPRYSPRQAEVTIDDGGGSFASGDGVGTGFSDYGPLPGSLWLHNPDGSVDPSGSAFLGETLPMVANVGGDTSHDEFYFEYDSSAITVSTSIGGAAITPGFGNWLASAPSDTTYYVSAANPSDGEPAGGGVELWFFDGITTGGIAGVELNENPFKLYRDGVDITGGTPQSNAKCNAMVGTMINLAIGAPNGCEIGADVPTCIWSVAGSTVADYIPNKNASVLVPFDDNQYNRVIHFAWYTGGSKAVSVNALTPWGEGTAHATFNVVRPGLTPTVTAYIGGNAKNPKGGTWPGITLFNQPGFTEVQFGDKTTGVNGVIWKGTGPVPVPGSDYSECQYGFAQVATVKADYSTGRLENKTYDLNEPGKRIDNVFPYNQGTFSNRQAIDGEAVEGDSPGFFVVPGGTSHYNLQLTVWYMFQPPGGIWVPLSNQVWSLNLVLDWSSPAIQIPGVAGVFGGTQVDPVVEDATVTIGGQTLASLKAAALKTGTITIGTPADRVAAPSFVDSTKFPEWTGYTVNTPIGSPYFVLRTPLSK